MILQNLVLYHFRNRTDGSFNLSPHLTVLLGENARGKTNLLEAVYFLINGTGFRESREEELMMMGENEAMVEGRFVMGKNKSDFKIHLQKKGISVEKTYFMERAKKKHAQYLADQTKAILFTPEQIEIINGSPDLRRDYFNKIISYYNVDYKKKLINLENALRRRNKVLEHTKDDINLREELSFWNKYVVDQSTYITKIRQEYVNYLNCHKKLDHKSFSITYLKNEATLERFEEYFFQEKKWRRTLIGPQKDDFQIFLETDTEKNVHHYGSRSEQRLAIFWLKMNEITYYENTFHKPPLLLLDDVFSEFDKANKLMIGELIKKYQTILTTTEDETIDRINIPKKIIKL